MYSVFVVTSMSCFSRFPSQQLGSAIPLHNPYSLVLCHWLYLMSVCVLRTVRTIQRKFDLRERQVGALRLARMSTILELLRKPVMQIFPHNNVGNGIEYCC